MLVKVHRLGGLNNKKTAERADRYADALRLAEQIAINIKTGEREQVTDAPLTEAYEFYKRVAA